MINLRDVCRRCFSMSSRGATWAWCKKALIMSRKVIFFRVLVKEYAKNDI